MASTNSSPPPREWFNAVEHVAGHNGSVVLRPGDNDAAKGLATRDFRVRLLRIDNGQWLVDRPFARPGEASIRVGMNVTGVIGANTLRFGFGTRVTGQEIVALNEEKEIAALRLAPPTGVHVVQRRAYFRVETGVNDMPPVRLWPIRDVSKIAQAERSVQRAIRGKADEAGPTRPVDGDPIVATAVDISGNGVALAMGAGDRPAVADADLLWLEMDLPNAPAPVGLAVKPVRLDQREGGMIVGGFSFQFLFDREHRADVIDQICAFAALQQRRLLQRNR